MQLTVCGESSYISVDICRQAIRYFAHELLSKRIYKNIKIKVIFTTEGLKGGKASCEWVDRPRFGRSFIICVSPYIGEKLTLLSLAHEMVHVKQWATGELMDYLSNCEKSMWKGKVFYCLKDDDYWTLPWEIEAYGREIGLYHMFEQNEY